MDPSSADPHLRAKTIAKTVREARARVHKHTSRIDVTHERATGRSRLCDDAVGVMRAVLVGVSKRCSVVYAAGGAENTCVLRRFES